MGSDDDLHANSGSSRGGHGDGLRMAVLADEKGVDPRVRARVARHGHGLSRGRGLVQERGIGHIEASQVADHCLEDQQGLQSALRDLCLIRSVGRVPAGVLEDVAPDDRRGHGLMVTHAEIGTPDLVFGSDGLESGQSLVLAESLGKMQQTLEADVLGHGRVSQSFQRRIAQKLEHPGPFLRTGAQVARSEALGRRDLGRRGLSGPHGLQRSSGRPDRPPNPSAC